MSNRKYSVDFDALEKKLQKFLKVSEERQRDANKHNKDGRSKHNRLSAPRRENT